MRLFRRTRFTLCDETPGAAPLPPTEAAKWAPPDQDALVASLERELAMLRGNLRLARTRYQTAEHELLTIRGDRDRLADANGPLCERIRGLELTVASLRAPDETLQMPRMRSMPGPGGGR